MNCRTFSQNPRTPPLFLTPYDRERNLFAIKQWQATKDKTQLKKKNQPSAAWWPFTYHCGKKSIEDTNKFQFSKTECASVFE